MSKIDISLDVNGTKYSAKVEPRRTLADTLREDCGLTGTHLGCEHGVCGACTVLVNDEPVRSCLMFAVQAQDSAIRTVEGLADGDKLNELRLMHIEGKRDQVKGCSTCTVLHDVPRQSDLDGVSDHLLSVYSKGCSTPIR